MVYVCFERDIECGRNPATWCATCPQHPAPEGEISYELIQDDQLVASTSGLGALAEIKRYAAQYEQDGPVEIFRCVRTPLPAVPAVPRALSTGEVRLTVECGDAVHRVLLSRFALAHARVSVIGAHAEQMLADIERHLSSTKEA